MYNKASSLNLLLHIVLRLYIMMLHKAQKDPLAKQDATKSAVLITGKNRKSKLWRCANTVRKNFFS